MFISKKALQKIRETLWNLKGEILALQSERRRDAVDKDLIRELSMELKDLREFLGLEYMRQPSKKILIRILKGEGEKGDGRPY